MLDLRNIETFVWVAQLGGFRLAAEKLNTTQPAISARIAVLEQELGVRLFERKQRRAVLTEMGMERSGQLEKIPSPDMYARGAPMRRKLPRFEEISLCRRLQPHAGLRARGFLDRYPQSPRDNGRPRRIWRREREADIVPTRHAAVDGLATTVACCLRSGFR